MYLVRHGRAEAGWDTAQDPGLDAVGREQATSMADRLAPLGPLPLITSPLQRCQQTADVLASRWSTAPRIEQGVAEVPSPPGVEMSARVEWLRRAMAGTWEQLGELYTEFRDGVVDTVVAAAAAEVDTVVVSHFVAINAVIGAALGDDRVVLHSLDNCSVTIVEISPPDDSRSQTIRLVEAGREADTLIR